MTTQQQAAQAFETARKKTDQAAEVVRALENRLEWLEGERESLSYLANFEKDPQAVARLKEIDQEVKIRHATLDDKLAILENLQADQVQKADDLKAAELKDATVTYLQAEKKALRLQLDYIQLRRKLDSTSEKFAEARDRAHQIALDVRKLGGEAQGVVMPAGVSEDTLEKLIKSRIAEIDKAIVS